MCYFHTDICSSIILNLRTRWREVGGLFHILATPQLHQEKSPLLME